jgi:two-component system CheB/CheR fusion protein
MTIDEPLFPVVGIGASAGGVQAIETFFRALQSDPGLAVV